MQETHFYYPQQLRTPMSTTPGLYAEFVPAEWLRPFICCYWVSPVVPAMVVGGAVPDEPLVPDGCIDLVLSLQRHTGETRVLLVGPLGQSARVAMDYGRWQTFGIRFFPGWLHPFLREPAHRFTDRIHLLDAVSPALAAALGAVVEPGLTVTDRIERADRLFTAYLANAKPLPWDGTLLGGLDLLAQAVPVQLVARRLAVSERQLLRVFRERTGLTPKQFARTARFQRALALLHRAAPLPLSEIALAAGYCDQGHFTREFGALAGITPARCSGGFIQDPAGAEVVRWRKRDGG